MVWVVLIGYERISSVSYYTWQDPQFGVGSTFYFRCCHHLSVWTTVPWCYSWASIIKLLQPDSLQSKAEWCMPLISAVRKLRQWGSWLRGQPQLQGETLFQKQNKTKIPITTKKFGVHRWLKKNHYSLERWSMALAIILNHSICTVKLLCTCNDEVWDNTKECFWTFILNSQFLWHIHVQGR